MWNSWGKKMIFRILLQLAKGMLYLPMKLPRTQIQNFDDDRKSKRKRVYPNKSNPIAYICMMRWTLREMTFYTLMKWWECTSVCHLRANNNLFPATPGTCNSTEGRSGSTQQVLHRLSEPGLPLDALDPPCADPDVLKALLQCSLEFRLLAGGEEAGELCCLLVGGELMTRNI